MGWTLVRKGPYRPPAGRWPQPVWRVVAAAGLLVAAFYGARMSGVAGLLPTSGPWAAGWGRPARAPAWLREAAEARMRMGLAVLAQEAARRGVTAEVPLEDDPGRTGLIGVPFSPITTTLGQLAAKRTALHPGWAPVLVDLLWEAGVRPGDVVAAGLSGSFPGLNLAVMVAGEAMQLRLVAVASLGASSWGANRPGWTWADMEAALVARGVLQTRASAYTLGGDDDRGGGISPDGQRLLEAAARHSGVPLWRPADLAEAVTERLALYRAAAARWGRPMAAYVNVGGSEASLGRCPSVLRARPGLIRPGAMPRCPVTGEGSGGWQQPGVMQWMAEAGVPVIHLLNIRGLAAQFGLPLDPG